MSHPHPRIAFLADLLGLRPAEGDGERSLADLVLRRLEKKCERLRDALTDLSRSASESTIARACAVPRWHLLIHMLAQPAYFAKVTSGRWSVAEVLPAAADIDSIELPLSDGQRLYARHFAVRLAKALALEQPAAHDLAARLNGAENWRALVGDVPAIAPDEPLYIYEKSECDSADTAMLLPSAGCVRLTAELTALTYFADPESRAHAARHALVRRPDFLAAARIAVDALIEQGVNGEALDCANRTLYAFKKNILPVAACLDVCSTANVEYFRLHCARVIALTRLEQFDDAAQGRSELVTDLVCAGAPGEALVAQWLAEYEGESSPWLQAKEGI
jgi:hypothetical protein